MVKFKICIYKLNVNTNGKNMVYHEKITFVLNF